MAAMTEVMENSAVQPQEEEAFTAAGKDQTSLVESFENTLDVSQDVGLTVSGETDRQEKLEDRQKDRQTVSPPAESKWVVGAQCRAVWSEDGQLYPAKVVSVDGERCRVCFHGYGNEEDVELSALKSPDAAPQTQTPNCQDWRPGSRCRAVYSEDGLVYPAVVLWVKGQRCRVRFDNYNNEEEQDISSLLSPDELHGPSGVPAAKGSSWRRKRREENQGESGAERRSGWREDQHDSSWVKEKLSHQNKVEKEAKEKKRGAEKPTNHSFSFFPPFPPPPPQPGSGDPVTFIPPPPPPLWSFGGTETSSSFSSMLMLWYMCGFHTGSYMAQQEFKSKD